MSQVQIVEIICGCIVNIVAFVLVTIIIIRGLN